MREEHQMPDLTENTANQTGGRPQDCNFWVKS